MVNTRGFKLAAFILPLILVAALPCVLPEVMDPGHVISTDASQWHHATLPDGTALHVDARSTVKIEYTGKARIVVVDRGSAVFEVAKDPAARPFIARTHLIDAAAAGTRFGVSIDAGVTVTVSEGIVKVTSPGKYGTGPAISLKAGEELRVPEGSGSEPTHTKVDAERKLEWATGWLVFEGSSIGDVVEEFNRRNAVQIEIEHPEIAARPLRGFQRFRVDSSLALARYIADTNGLELIEDRSGSVVRLRTRADPRR